MTSIMKNKEKKVIVVLGPTSSGKSELAVQIAKKFNGEIISADSRQIFKDMDLGTGKVEGEWEDDKFIYKDIPHYLIDFVDPQDEYNISHFKKDCEELIDKILDNKKTPIVCGGTGFWILSVVNDIEFPAVKPNEKLRKELADKNEIELLKMLQKLDLKRAGTVDQKNKIRLIRAIEIAKELGEVPELNLFEKGKNKKFKFLQIGIDCPKEDLEKKIKKRLESRFLEGMIEEVENLKEKNNLSWKKIQSFGLGYYWIPLFLQGEISKEELKQKVFEAERRYAKRQRTWFGKHGGVEWVKNLDEAERLVGNFLE
jgi:tRNA dimethylallyltransferase